MIQTDTDILVLGGGVAGLTSATALADLGYAVTVVERAARLGGHAAEWACMATDCCARCSACLLDELVTAVRRHPGIEIRKHCDLVALDGEAGAFTAHLQQQSSAQAATDEAASAAAGAESLTCRAVMTATGFQPFDATAKPLLGLGRFPEVTTLDAVDHLLREDRVNDFLPAGEPQRLAFVQCVGSRELKGPRDFCSQYCCRTTIRLARRLRHLRPDVAITVHYIDLQIMSKEFRRFFAAAQEGIRFVQGVPAEVLPGAEEGTVQLRQVDPEVHDQAVFERVVLATGMAPQKGQQQLAEVLGTTLDARGFFQRPQPEPSQLTSRKGVWAIGAAGGPTDIQTSRTQALAAASEVARSLGAVSDRQPATAGGAA